MERSCRAGTLVRLNALKECMSAPVGATARLTRDYRVGDTYVYVAWDRRSLGGHGQVDGDYWPRHFDEVGFAADYSGYFSAPRGDTAAIRACPPWDPAWRNRTRGYCGAQQLDGSRWVCSRDAEHAGPHRAKYEDRYIGCWENQSSPGPEPMPPKPVTQVESVPRICSGYSSNESRPYIDQLLRTYIEDHSGRSGPIDILVGGIQEWPSGRVTLTGEVDGVIRTFIWWEAGSE